ncbi:MAG: hypothetical protein PVG22_00565 [Chromatiales bacterium]|jgi:hypothetical protein
MSDIEKIEVARYSKEINEDIEHLVKKYCRIMGWEVPELDEGLARELIIKVLKESIQRVEAG